MKKGLLICSGGMSTTMIAKALNEKAKGIMVFSAIGLNTTGDFDLYIPGNAIILISPQIRFQSNQVKSVASKLGIPAIDIAPTNYITTRVDALWEDIKKNLKD